jgi:hypothetical protein
MKLNKILGMLGVAVGALTLSASAQVNDWYSTTIPLQLAAPNIIAGSATPLTNNTVDIAGYQGRGFIFVSVSTNQIAGGGVLSLTVQGSADNTNWSNISNYALTTKATAFTYTNQYWGSTNQIATNNFLLPFTITYPVATSSGFATPYSLPNLFTNTAATNAVNATGNTVIGLNLQDNLRYLHTIWISQAGYTNTVSATLFGGRSFNY